MAEITIGDYIYNTDGSVKCVDKTKQTYGPILSEFEYEGNIYTVTNMDGCFSYCTSLIQAPEIPSGVTNMFNCFADCSSLNQAPEIPSGVTDMRTCFYGCSSLTQAPEIPSGVTNMWACFSTCSNLTKAPEIPSSVTDMRSCFYGCTSLTGIIIIHTIPTQSVRDIFTNTTNQINILPINDDDLTTDVYNYWVSVAGGYSNVSVLTSGDRTVKFTIDEYRYQIQVVTSKLSAKVFDTTKTQYNSIKTRILVGNSLCELGVMRRCFEGCSHLTQAPEIPITVINMTDCFRGCSSLTQAPDMPSGVRDMYRCFGDCTSLTQAPEIPSGVTDLRYCFMNCSALTQAPEIPSSVTNMSDCFRGCSSLTKAPDIPSSVRYIDWCFYECSLLTQAPEISNGVTTMNSCFNGCSSLIQAPEIPSSVTDMVSCFGRCSSLTQAPEIPSGVTDLRYCFSGCSSLTQAPEIPSDVTDMTSCFSGCSSLTQAPEIPSSVTDMDWCFYECSSLRGNIIFHSVIASPYSNIFRNTTQQIFLFNGTSPKDASITTILRDIASQYPNVIFEFDGLISPSTNLNVIRVDDDNETTSSLTGTWFYLTATTTTYNDGLPDNWHADLNSIILKADSLDITQDSHIIGPTVISDNKYNTKSWYDTDNLAQHTIDFVTVLQVYDENDEPQGLKEFTFKVIFSSSVPLVHYLAGGHGIAFGGEAEADKFICYLDAEFLGDVNVGGGAPIGTIAQYAGSVEPDGWFICNGRALNRETYSELFDAIGTTYGAGDGSTTFNIPDFRGRLPQGAGVLGNEEYTLGDSIEAGLPNIEGVAAHNATYSGTNLDQNSCTGAFYGATATSQHYLNGRGLGSGWYDIGFDASRSNPIYGNSDTVQPNTTIVNFIIKWKNVSTSQTGITVEEMAALLRPIGSVYETQDEDFDPNVSWGGTWTLIAESVISDIAKRQVEGTINRQRGYWTSITAPTVNGYEFDFWGQIATSGWVSSLYVEYATSQTTNVWNVYSDGTGNGTFFIYAHYVKRETVYRWTRTA